MSITRKALCLVLAAPSGTGKSSVARALLQQEPGLVFSVSATTRPPRPGERDGVDYRFLSQVAFDRLLAGDGLLEWARVLGRDDCYGTPRAPIEAALQAGQDVLFDIDWQGHRSLRAAFPGQVVGVFLLPPTMTELEARLVRRSGETAEEIVRRMAHAREEIAHCGEFDHVLVNGDFTETVAAVRAVLTAGRTATSRLSGLADFLAGLA
jgi:guanylate kinase